MSATDILHGAPARGAEPREGQGEEGGREDKVLEHVEVEVVHVLRLKLPELLLELGVGDFVVDLLHELLELSQGDDTLLAGGLHFVKTLPEPSLQSQSVGSCPYILPKEFKIRNVFKTI